MNFITLASGSAGNAYLVQDGAHHLLIEAGIPYKRLMSMLWDHGSGLSDLEGCLISHAHGDHSCSAEKVSGATVHTFASQETLDTLGLGCGAWVHSLTAGEERLSFQWRIMPFDVPHDCDGTLGFLVRTPSGSTLVYASDLAYCGFTFKDVNVFAIECNYDPEIIKANVGSGTIHTERYKRTIQTHMSLPTCIAMLKANVGPTCQEIHLLHLSDANSDSEKFKRAVEKEFGIPCYIAGEK